jgi:hypothetical protein
LADFTDYFSGGRVGFVKELGSELFAKGVGNLFGRCEGVIAEGDGLIRWEGGGFAGEIFQEGPVFAGIVAVVGVGEGFLPFLAGMC